MCRKLSDWLRRVSKGWVALSALVISLLFFALVLPGQAASAERDTGGAGSPDMSFFYSPGDLYRMAEAYGEQGRQAYVRARFTFDVVLPLVYTLFLVTAISWVNARAFPPDSLWQRANLVPVLGALFDYAENVSTSLVMLRFPAQTPVIDLLAPLFTLVKWVFVTGSFGLLFIGEAEREGSVSHRQRGSVGPVASTREELRRDGTEAGSMARQEFREGV
jgi:hypothetical protein